MRGETRGTDGKKERKVRERRRGKKIDVFTLSPSTTKKSSFKNKLLLPLSLTCAASPPWRPHRRPRPDPSLCKSPSREQSVRFIFAVSFFCFLLLSIVRSNGSFRFLLLLLFSPRPSPCPSQSPSSSRSSRHGCSRTRSRDSCARSSSTW